MKHSPNHTPTPSSVQVVLGFCGRAKSGKTTAVDSIVNYVQHRLKWKVYTASFGHLVCNYCVKNGILPEQTERERATPDQLKIIVDTGMRCRERFGDWFWLDQFDIEIFEQQPQVVLCPNVRMPNEVEWVQGMSGRLVRCVKLNADGSEYISPDRDPNHITETATRHINADFHITAKDGQNKLVEKIAVDIFNFVRGA